MGYRVGTSGWHYEHWRGTFYPPELRPREWLACYATRFDTVELNNSFYRQPRDTTWDLWRTSVPEGFCFAVKANRFITHIRRLRDVAEPLARFLAGARRLRGSLGPVLYQLPPGFGRSAGNMELLAEFVAMLPAGIEHAIEFRDPSWFAEDCLALLRQHGTGFCAYDMPGIECPLVATARFAYMRFHGAGTLYAGNYDEAALRAWAGRLRALGGGVETLYIYFNNDAWGFAPQNALRLGELLEGS